jgi:hypothetical protein
MHPGAKQMSRSISKARRFQRKLLRCITRTAALPPSAERDQRLNRERDRYVRSAGVKAAYLRKMKRHRAKADAAISKMANRSNVLTAYNRPVTWWYKAKDSGDVRRICNPPTKVRLGQLIAKDLIVAQVRPDQGLYDWPGRGIHRYVSDICNALETVGPYAFITDIRDCYDHVNIDNVYELDLLPAELIRSSIDTRCLSFRRSHRQSDDIASRVIVLNSADPCGLMQGGPASSAIVVALLGNVSGSVPATTRVSGIADDFNVVGADRPIVGDAGEDLTRYLTECPLGPSEFKRPQVFDVRDGFHHVGCLFWQIDDTISALIPPEKLDALIDRMAASIANPVSEDRGRSVDHFVRKALGPYPWAPNWQRERISEAAYGTWSVSRAGR